MAGYKTSVKELFSSTELWSRNWNLLNTYRTTPAPQNKSAPTAPEHGRIEPKNEGIVIVAQLKKNYQGGGGGGTVQHVQNLIEWFCFNFLTFFLFSFSMEPKKPVSADPALRFLRREKSRYVT